MIKSAILKMRSPVSRGGLASIMRRVRLYSTVIVISAAIAAGCGGFAANAKQPVKLSADAIAGRWQGQHYGYGMRRSGNGSDMPKLTLDISACLNGWCGVAVKDDGSCGAVAMKVEFTSEKGNDRTTFKGKLELAPGSEAFVIQANLWQADDATKLQMHIIGDTGPELRLFRRSFPLQATLEHTGESVCTIEKATS